ncbi:MAG TPA: PaaI family thioesterase [Propionibacteriaceae bacterium]
MVAQPGGVIAGGVPAFAADGALGTAIHTTLGPRRVLATSDLTFSFIPPPDPDSDAIIVRSQLIHEGTTQALAEATIEDPVGHLLARGGTRCLIIDVRGPLPEPPHEPVPDPDYQGPHPHQRPPEGEILPQQVWDSTNGIDLLRGWQRGTLPRSPLSNLIGTRVLQVAEGAITCAIPASPWFCGIGGTLYGGVLALLADYAIHGAVQSVLSTGTAWAPLDLKVRFLRSSPTDTRCMPAPGWCTAATGSRSPRSRSSRPERSPRSPTPRSCCCPTALGRTHELTDEPHAIWAPIDASPAT